MLNVLKILKACVFYIVLFEVLPFNKPYISRKKCCNESAI